jgi:hypothetical protein
VKITIDTNILGAPLPHGKAPRRPRAGGNAIHDGLMDIQSRAMQARRRRGLRQESILYKAAWNVDVEV